LRDSDSFFENGIESEREQTTSFACSKIRWQSLLTLAKCQACSKCGDGRKPAQLAALYAASNRRNKLAFIIMLGTGCRPSTADEFVGEGLDFDSDPPSNAESRA
jgi:hypothetical protein